MYKALTAKDYLESIKLKQDYTVDGFLIFGTYQKYPYEELKESLLRIGCVAEFRHIEDEFLNNILEFKVNNKTYWFTVAYGGVLLSEYLHLACLFGSKMNILLGSCGGLKKGADSGEIIVPEWSYAEESSAKAYQPDADNKYLSNKELSEQLVNNIDIGCEIHRGATITYQAMLAETWEDIQRWVKQGYVGVEMEAATIFSVSNHFNIPSAAILMIADNLIEKETVLDISYDESKERRRGISSSIFDVALRKMLGKIAK